MLYMVLVCVKNSLSFFKINLIGKFFKSWIYPYTPGMLYICYGKLYLHNSSHVIQFKCKVWQPFVYNFYHVHNCKLELSMQQIPEDHW